MRRILIVGAGQAGLQLALSLQAEGYDVTVMSARTPDEIRNGWPTSTQVMMYRALDRERDVKLNLWDDAATPIGGIGFNLSPAPGVSAFSFSGAWARPGNSVDQRLKMPAWIELFEQRGGRVIYHSVMTSDLAGLAPMYDLTIIAAGKGEIVEMFDRDAERSLYSRPARNLAAIYLNGIDAFPGAAEPRMRVNLRPGAGEYLHMQSHTLTGPCDVLLVEAVPGGPFDIFTDRPSPAEHLRRLHAMLAEHFPWEAELYRNAEPTDARASLVGAFPGTVRRALRRGRAGQLRLRHRRRGRRQRPDQRPGRQQCRPRLRHVPQGHPGARQGAVHAAVDAADLRHVLGARAELLHPHPDDARADAHPRAAGARGGLAVPADRRPVRQHLHRARPPSTTSCSTRPRPPPTWNRSPRPIDSAANR